MGFTPPPLLMLAKYARNRVGCGYHTAPLLTLLEKNPPPCWGGIIKLEGGSVWFSHRLVGIWNIQTGSRGHERPPPTPAVSPAPSFPIPLASSLCFPSLSLPLTPTHRFRCLQPSKRGEATIRLSSPVMWHLVVV